MKKNKITQDIHLPYWKGSLLLICVSFIAGAALGWISFLFARRVLVSSLKQPFIIPSVDVQLIDQTTQGLPPELPTSTLQSTLTLTPTAQNAQMATWDGIGRVSILIMGIDYRDWEQNNTNARSDTMIIMSLDPLTGKAGILSIPRDLWVEIPGFTHNKINTAHYLGDVYKYPGGGPALASKTVEQLLGIPVNYYARIDFSAFINFIDEIGGVKIDVPEKITIDLLGSGSKTKKTLQPGIQVLPGSWALAYARARHTEGGDFDRSKRQQQVIMAIRDRVLNMSMLPQLVTKAPRLYQELSKGINTNLSLVDATKLAYLVSQVKEADIIEGVINEKYVTFAKSSDNLDILIPVPDKIRLLRDEVFGDTRAFEPLAQGSDIDKMVAEDARISIKNESSNPDLSNRISDYLQNQGLINLNILTDGKGSPYTTITDHTGKPYTMKYLIGLLHISKYRIYMKYDPNNQYDVEVTLGNEVVSNNSLP
jgi:LCP family protein required for cell wall assembly